MTDGYGEAIVFEHLDAVEMRRSQLPVYDREIELGLLYEDPDTGAEHYVVRYPADLRARPHRHTAAHTIVVLEGLLAVNGEIVGPGAYCHFAAGEPMLHAPGGEEGCLFLLIFHGPFDVEPVGDRPWL